VKHVLAKGNETGVSRQRRRDNSHIEAALHQSLHDTEFRFVNIAHWESGEAFNSALGSDGFHE
jgi:hypothetical protein